MMEHASAHAFAGRRGRLRRHVRVNDEFGSWRRGGESVSTAADAADGGETRAGPGPDGFLVGSGPASL